MDLFILRKKRPVIIGRMGLSEIAFHRDRRKAEITKLANGATRNELALDSGQSVWKCLIPS
jgi:hypothetical protein